MRNLAGLPKRRNMLLQNELIVDSFAGGGGASTGIEQALGRSVDIAINHNPAAIAMHAENHPDTRHFNEDVFKVSPRKVTSGKPVGLLWASPDCRHFSRAKGSKPVEKSIRGLAWVVVKWATEVKPRVIILENVREFQDWGPLIPRWKCSACNWNGTEGQKTLARRSKKACPRCESTRVVITEDLVPDPERKGLTFRQFTGRLKAQGYRVEWRVLDAADFGAPTHRKRLFLIARRDKEPIRWPDPTHGDPKKIGRGLFDQHLKPWRTAAECIDWTVPCPSIFERKKPLAEKTLRRIAMGIKRYVLDNPKPFLVTVNHGGEHFRGRGADEPLPTITGSNAEALVTPVITRIGQTGGKGSYSHEATQPLGTITSKAEHLLVSPHITKFRTGAVGSDIEEPLPTVTANSYVKRPGGCAPLGLVAASLIQTGYGEREGQAPRALDIEAPLGTVLGTGKHAVVSAFLAKHFGDKGQRPGVSLDEPTGTITAVDHHSLVAANLVHMNHGEKTWNSVEEPLRTITSGNHAALVYSFLTKYFGTGCGQEVDDPLHTITGKDRFGVVTVSVDGVPHVITDIGMRMLRPRELARAQGFPDDYILTGSATNQVERIGNSVCPAVARAVVEANLVESEAFTRCS
jgi:DNA (cytosine-5)-methyltransferase 1